MLFASGLNRSDWSTHRQDYRLDFAYNPCQTSRKSEASVRRKRSRSTIDMRELTGVVYLYTLQSLRLRLPFSPPKHRGVSGENYSNTSKYFIPLQDSSAGQNAFVELGAEHYQVNRLDEVEEWSGHNR
nr:LOW QUALITY PROTEIN: hypothetical protein L203_02298 [Cryptococcus depauperatus CBS 7841]